MPSNNSKSEKNMANMALKSEISKTIGVQILGDSLKTV
jgi:hypothetical protein